MTSDLNGIREASCATDSISVSLGCVALCNVTTWCNGAIGSVGFYIVRFCATHHSSRCAFVAWGQKKNRYPLSLRFILSLSHSFSLTLFPVTGLYTYMYRPSSPSMRIFGFYAPRVCPVHRVYRVFWLFLACGKKVYKRITKPTIFFSFFFCVYAHFQSSTRERWNMHPFERLFEWNDGVDRSCLVEILY